MSDYVRTALLLCLHEIIDVHPSIHVVRAAREIRDAIDQIMSDLNLLADIIDDLLDLIRGSSMLHHVTTQLRHLAHEVYTAQRLGW